jgi:hypothetical protein
MEGVGVGASFSLEDAKCVVKQLASGGASGVKQVVSGGASGMKQVVSGGASGIRSFQRSISDRYADGAASCTVRELGGIEEGNEGTGSSKGAAAWQ